MLRKQEKKTHSIAASGTEEPTRALGEGAVMDEKRTAVWRSDLCKEIVENLLLSLSCGLQVVSVWIKE